VVVAVVNRRYRLTVTGSGFVPIPGLSTTLPGSSRGRIRRVYRYQNYYQVVVDSIKCWSTSRISCTNTWYNETTQTREPRPERWRGRLAETPHINHSTLLHACAPLGVQFVRGDHKQSVMAEHIIIRTSTLVSVVVVICNTVHSQ
jgi:hypothetical protein